MSKHGRARLVAAAAAVVFALASALCAEQITGTVFLDANGNGAREATEGGVADVCVSDGLTVVKTGGDGAYSIDTKPGKWNVFVIQPNGHECVGEFWRRIFVPRDGTAKADFPLKKAEQKAPFLVAIGSDVHMTASAVDRAATYVKALNTHAEPLAFVMHVGDLVMDSNRPTFEEGRKLFELYKKTFSPIAVRRYDVPGNHDHPGIAHKIKQVSHPLFGYGMFRELLGPDYYSWNYAGWHFVALNATWLKPDGGYGEGIRPEQMEWLKQDLAALPPRTPICVAAHQPLRSLPNTGDLVKLLSGYNVKASFGGHWHTVNVGRLGSAPDVCEGAVSGAWWGGPCSDENPCGFALARFYKDRFEWAYRGYLTPFGPSMPTPRKTAILSRTLASQITFYDPEKKITKVTFRIGNQSRDMTPINGPLVRKASVEIPIEALADDFYKLQATLHHDGEPVTAEKQVLVITGKEQVFTAKTDAVLHMKLQDINQENRVLVNDHLVGVTPAQGLKDGRLEQNVKPEWLKRINYVRFESVGDGKNLDDFHVTNIMLRYGGKDYYDLRRNRNTGYWVGDNDNHQPKLTVYIPLPN